MIGVRIGVMMMVVAVPMTVRMIMIVVVLVVAALGRPRADALDMMVMALLREANLGLEAEDLLAVLKLIAERESAEDD